MTLLSHATLVSAFLAMTQTILSTRVPSRIINPQLIDINAKVGQLMRVESLMLQKLMTQRAVDPRKIPVYTVLTLLSSLLQLILMRSLWMMKMRKASLCRL
ncbi:hypothetical protein AB205_0079760 [Aquarana catesbeiana]|uniref:Secreted protein n=1 Tax=Aquarana catesbeiana TaxID=8400 RepID=A0A2G9QED9_AQUCT|nr:hypothetical protein AB205_0079760 [Aquarana catesbeiana]